MYIIFINAKNNCLFKKETLKCSSSDLQVGITSLARLFKFFIKFLLLFCNIVYVDFAKIFSIINNIFTNFLCV